MSVIKKTAIAAVSALSAAVLLSAPADADPVENPCDLAINFFCRFVPIAPHLEGDVDLTQQLPPADPAAPPPESLPPADICAAGCI